MRTFHALSFIALIAAKVVGGMYLSTWSWWWLLFPEVPIVGTIISGFAR